MSVKHFVLDTNVLIENPKCIFTLRNGKDNQVYVPYTVLTELDKLKKDPRVGHIVAQAVRAILADGAINIFLLILLRSWTTNAWTTASSKRCSMSVLKIPS